MRADFKSAQRTLWRDRRYYQLGVADEVDGVNGTKSSWKFVTKTCGGRWDAEAFADLAAEYPPIPRRRPLAVNLKEEASQGGGTVSPSSDRRLCLVEVDPECRHFTGPRPRTELPTDSTVGQLMG